MSNDFSFDYGIEYLKFRMFAYSTWTLNSE